MNRPVKSLLCLFVCCNMLLLPHVAMSDDFMDIANVILRNGLTSEISKALQGALPQCYGEDHDNKKCTPGSAKHGSVFYKHSKWAYKVFDRYVDDINTLQINEITVDEVSGRLVFNASGTYPKTALKSYIYIGECFTFDKCSKIWANDHNFAQGYQVKLTLTFDCANGRFELTSDANVNLDLTPGLVIKEGVGSIHFDVKHITNEVEHALKNLLWKEMEDDIIEVPKTVKVLGKVIPLPHGGTKISVADIPNFIFAPISPSIKDLCPPSKKINTSEL